VPAIRRRRAERRAPPTPPAAPHASKEGATQYLADLSTPPRNPCADPAEQHTRDDHGDREPDERQS
jgi:hypothetical protein